MREEAVCNDQTMEALQLAAQLILEYGGETFRAEETVRRMGEGFGLSEVESFAVPSGLFISYRTETGELETSVRRVHKQGTDLTIVDETNHVSRAAAEGLIGAPFGSILLFDAGKLVNAWQTAADVLEKRG